MVGDWELQPNALLITRNGSATKLSPRAMDVLVYLAERAGETVTHEELLAAFWRGPNSATNSVHKTVADLRHALGNDAANPAYIETVPKRGYRLVVSVERIAATQRPAQIATGSTYLITLANQRAAILVPPDPIEQARGETTFLESIQRELVARVAQLPNMSVTIATGAAMMITDYRVELTCHTADDQLHASLVVTPGSLELPYHQQQFTAASHDRLTLSNDVIAQGVEVLAVLLDDRHLERMREWGTRNVDAYRDALEGDVLRRGQSFAVTQQAEALFKSALEKDPRFAMAYCCLAYVYHDLGMMAKDTPTREAVRQELQALLRNATQRQIDPQAILEIEQQYRFVSLVNPFDAEAFWRAEIIKNPSNTDALRRYGDLLLGAKLINESEGFLNRALAFSNENSRDWLEQDQVSIAEARGDLDRQIQLGKRNLERFPDHTYSTYGLARSLAKLGRYSEAEFYLSRLDATDAPWAFFGRMTLSAIRGDLQPGGNQLAHAFADPLANNANRGVICFILGDVEGGVRYWRDIEPGFLPLLWQFITGMEWFWAPGVAEDPHYQALLDDLGFGRKWRAHMRTKVAELAPITGVEVTTPHEVVVGHSLDITARGVHSDAESIVTHRYPT